VPTGAPKKKLSYKEQRELESLPGLIEALEQEQKAIQGELADGSLYRTDGVRAAQLAERSTQIDDALIAALERWEHLG
jgi:ATP-binding cassette subfamily F protein uup